MRTSLLVLAALAGIATPALAQDRTLPAGDYMFSAPTPVDTQVAPPAVTTREGRSVGTKASAVSHRRSHIVE